MWAKCQPSVHFRGPSTAVRRSCNDRISKLIISGRDWAKPWMYSSVSDVFFRFFRYSSILKNDCKGIAGLIGYATLVGGKRLAIRGVV